LRAIEIQVLQAVTGSYKKAALELLSQRIARPLRGGEDEASGRHRSRKSS